MDMTGYVNEVEYAATHLLDAIWHEHSKLAEAQQRLAALEAETNAGYERAQAIWANAEDPDDVMMGAGAHWETYFGPDKERHHVAQGAAELRQLVDLHEFSVSSLAGSLLQHAKQGISIVHGGLANCPDGRTVASQQNLKTVVWQARNQAIHWEEGNLRPAVRACFDDLRDNVEPVFGAYHTRSLAFEVVQLLGWTDLARFKADLASLA